VAPKARQKCRERFSGNTNGLASNYKTGKIKSLKKGFFLFYLEVK
jgi:hypothetical protein